MKQFLSQSMILWTRTPVFFRSSDFPVVLKNIQQPSQTATLKHSLENTATSWLLRQITSKTTVFKISHTRKDN